MSSITEDQPGNFSPPSSPPEPAQPFQSLFGGEPSNQDVDLEPYPESLGGAGAARNEQDDLDVIMGNIPMMEDNQSDATYHASDEDESKPERNHGKGDTDGRVKKRKRPAAVGSMSTRKREEADSPPSSPVYRPNRFRGHESTWRKLTLEERQNAQALETIRAGDLAAHLYNAYALRVRVGERGMKIAEGDKKLNKSDAFAPPRRWTAWPMLADEVPRPDERLRREEYDAWSLRMPSDPRPSADMEENFMAIMMKAAKERIGARDWESKRSNSVPRKRGESRFEPYDDSTGNEEDWNSDDELTDGADLLPVVQADDDKSKQQLRPIARNILTQFDKLLIGLHHSQKGDVADDSSVRERQSDTESVASSMSPVKKDARDEVERNQSRGRKRNRVSSRSSKSIGDRLRSAPKSIREDSSHGGSQHVSHARGRSVGLGNGRPTSRLREGLRDWSEVVGIAAMVGCPSAAVMRAAKRCSALLGEDMEFQSFNEGLVGKVEQENGANAVQYIENEPELEVSPTPPPQPRPGRSRSRASSVKRESTSRPASPTIENDTEASLPKGKGQHRKLDLVCPVKKCPRHTNGFTRTWNLNLHMKRMHPGYRERSTSARAPFKIDNSQEEMADGQ